MPVLVNPYRYGTAAATYDSVMAGVSAVVGRWKFEEASGTTAADSVGSNTGTIAGTGVTYSTAGGGGVGNGLTFDGNTGEVTMPFSVTGLGTEGGFAYVFKTTDSAIIVRNDTSAAGTGTFIDLSGVTVVVRLSGTSQTITGLNSSTLKDGNKHLVILQTDGTTAEFWVDGVQKLTWAKTATWNTAANPNPWHLFRNGLGTGTSNFYAGTAFDFALTAGTRFTTTQIADLTSTF